MVATNALLSALASSGKDDAAGTADCIISSVNSNELATSRQRLHQPAGRRSYDLVTASTVGESTLVKEKRKQQKDSKDHFSCVLITKTKEEANAIFCV